MNQKDKLERLQNIRGCVVNVTVTFDMGLQIDILTSLGTLTNIGNYGQWPCFCFPMTDEVRMLQAQLQEGMDINIGDFMVSDLCKTLTTYHDFFQGDIELEQDKIRQIANTLKEEVGNLKCTGKKFYAFAAPEDRNMEFKLFASLKDLEIFFLDAMGGLDRLYTEMSEDEINACYDIAEENGWEGLPLQTIETD